MKHTKTTILTTFLIFSLAGCATTPSSSSQEKPQKRKGWIQEHLDNWLQSDWNPSTKEVDKKYGEDENRSSFTLQKFVDKAEVYCEMHPDTNSSHLEKLNHLPAIGK